jgi:hypothetical protein
MIGSPTLSMIYPLFALQIDVEGIEMNAKIKWLMMITVSTVSWQMKNEYGRGVPKY